MNWIPYVRKPYHINVKCWNSRKISIGIQRKCLIELFSHFVQTWFSSFCAAVRTSNFDLNIVYIIWYLPTHIAQRHNICSDFNCWVRASFRMYAVTYRHIQMLYEWETDAKTKLYKCTTTAQTVRTTYRALEVYLVVKYVY